MSQNLADGIVRILNADDHTAGTGFIVSDNGLIVTCAHVVRDTGTKPNGTVSLILGATKEQQYATVEAKYWCNPDIGEDIAILRLQGSLPKGATPLPLGSSVHSEGHDFSTFGFPELNPSEGMRAKGVVLGMKSEGGFAVLQLRSEEVTQGFSGAPIWDNTSQVVIGIVSRSMKNSSVKIEKGTLTLPYDRNWRFLYTAFATPTETLREVLYNPLVRATQPVASNKAMEEASTIQTN